MAGTASNNITPANSLPNSVAAAAHSSTAAAVGVTAGDNVNISLTASDLEDARSNMPRDSSHMDPNKLSHSSLPLDHIYQSNTNAFHEYSDAAFSQSFLNLANSEVDRNYTGAPNSYKDLGAVVSASDRDDIAARFSPNGLFNNHSTPPLDLSARVTPQTSVVHGGSGSASATSLQKLTEDVENSLTTVSSSAPVTSRSRLPVFRNMASDADAV